MHEKLVELLQSQAVADDRPWTIETAPDWVTVRATVKETAPDRKSAWELANKLADAVLDLGYEFSRALSTITVETSFRTNPPSWQGGIEVRVTPLVSQR
jgi:hypothetical protein